MKKPAASRLHGTIVTEVAFAGDAPSTKIQLFAFGSHKSRDGRGPWTLKDRAHAERVIAETAAVLGNTQMMIDYDHQLPFAALSKSGGQAVAAGWVQSFEIDEAGISATVDWTPQAQQRLADREYRYISPHFDVEKTTGLLRRFVNAALVNAPALDLAAVASIENTDSTGEDPMDLKAMAALLGLPEDSDAAAITAAIGKQNSVMTAVASALGVAADADIETITAAVTSAKAAGKPDPAKFVPIETVTAMQTTIASLETKVGGFEIERQTAAVDAAITQGKLIPAQREWALGLIKSDQGAFDTYLETAAIVPLGQRPKLDPAHRPGGDTLTADERVTCSMIGVSEEDFLAARKAEEAL